jgi:hypothetical protein
LQLRLYAPEDIETGDRFVTSPRSGATYRLAKDRIRLATRCALWLDGIRGYRAETIDPVVAACDFSSAAVCLPDISADERRFLDEEWARIEFEASTRSLQHIAGRIARISRHRGCRARNEAIAITHAYRAKRDTNCLPHSFWQAAVLRRYGVECTLLVGIWIPMNEAHAWIMAQHRPDDAPSIVVGDCIDKVMHYAPTLAFDF